MFEVKLKTFYKDGREVETTASAEHFIAFEEKYADQSALETLGQNPPILTRLYYLSWLTATSELEFKEWAKTMRDVDIVRTEVIVPFGPTTPDGPSQS